jgi:5-carboxymethyl-2-hydroxymuconate isomerase
MPSISISYSPNLLGEFDPQKLADALSQRAVELGVFPIWGIRVFVNMAEASSVADGDSELGYVQVAVRIAPGRSPELQTEITESLFATLEAELAVVKNRKIGFAVDLEEFQRETYRSGGSLPGSPTA